MVYWPSAASLSIPYRRLPTYLPILMFKVYVRARHQEASPLLEQDISIWVKASLTRARFA
jgi:hypothetical protein